MLPMTFLKGSILYLNVLAHEAVPLTSFAEQQVWKSEPHSKLDFYTDIFI